MSRLDKATVLAALRAEDVAAALGICALGDQRWRGRWLRTRSCARTHHNSACFGIARDGMWHCWSCDEGGDLIDLIAASLGIDARAAFGDVLAAAAQIAGVDAELDDPFTQAAPRAARPTRPPPPPMKPLPERIAAARARAEWAWERLHRADEFRLVAAYLKDERGLDAAAVLAREDVRATPLRLSADLRAAIDARDPRIGDDLRTLWWTMGTRRGTLSIVVPVRHVEDGALLDLRARRIAPEPNQPKIIGMVGGVTADAAQPGKPRRLLACYGHPHAIELAHVVVVEGLPDYLTALQVWPNAQVLGAVEAGSLSLVAGHAARALAARGGPVELTIVEQSDPKRLNHATGQLVAGAADAAINEDPNAATKVAVRYLGAQRLSWLLCEAYAAPAAKDLNDLWRAGLDPARMVVRWADIGEIARAG